MGMCAAALHLALLGNTYIKVEQVFVIKKF